jgi:hypothetical protein
MGRACSAPTRAGESARRGRACPARFCHFRASAFFSLLAIPVVLFAAPKDVSFTQSATSIDAYDFVEITATVAAPDVGNPFTGATLTGSFERADGGKRWQVEGFSDSDDGGVYRIRFMPSAPGDYGYSVAYRQGEFQKTFIGSFHANDGHRRGPIRVDPQYPWHFIWEGTGEHYFFNGTTAYWLIGWKDDHIINYSIDRLHKLKINRMRVTIVGRTNLFYGEPVIVGEKLHGFHWPMARREARGRLSSRLRLHALSLGVLAEIRPRAALRP